MPDTEAASVPSTLQALYVLKHATGPMDSHAIYAAGSFDYEALCYTALSSLWKKGIVTREKNERGLYEYQLPKNARLPEPFGRELAELESEGLPPPDPARRVGKSRAEYEKRTRSVTVTETVETVQPIAQEPAQATQPDPVTIEAQPEVTPLLPPPKPPLAIVSRMWDLIAEREVIEAQIAELKLLEVLTNPKVRDTLAEWLEDYADLLDFGIVGGEANKDDDAKIEARMADARAWAERFARQQNNPRSIFARAAAHLREWGGVHEDCERPEEAAECQALADIFEAVAAPSDEKQRGDEI